MVCPASILSSSLALSLLRQAAPPEQFVLSPFSLGSALAIIHDGAAGITQNELTQLLLNGCTVNDVTSHYSRLTTRLLRKEHSGVTLNVANRFYVDEKVPLLPEYQWHMKKHYMSEAKNIQFNKKEEAAATINRFVEGATRGKIRNFIHLKFITIDTGAVLINAVYFLGSWETPFEKDYTESKIFHGPHGDREEQFMAHYGVSFPANLADPDVIALKIPYKRPTSESENWLEEPDNDNYFFVLLPKDGVTLEKATNDINGARLQKILNGVCMTLVNVLLPRSKIESTLQANEVLASLGAETMFTRSANFSKISDYKMKVSKVMQKAIIEVDESGTEAAAATAIELNLESGFETIGTPIPIHMDRPFIYGIASGDDILFIGQYA